jgi:hypothetical protein
MAEASGTTFLDPDDGALMLDTDGSVRLADGVSDDCCCGECPEGCFECGDCCFGSSDYLEIEALPRVVVEWLVCDYSDASCTTLVASRSYRTVVEPAAFYYGVQAGDSWLWNVAPWGPIAEHVSDPPDCEYEPNPR